MTVAEWTELIGAVGSFFTTLAAVFTPIGAIVGGVGVILTILRQQRLERKVDAQGKVIQVVKTQNDGLISRMEIARDASQAEAKTATADASVARAETVVAQAAGVAAVLEANRTHEVSSASIEKGAKEAVEPIAKEAVKEGAKAAVAEMRREDAPDGS